MSRGKKKVRRSFTSLFKFTWSPVGGVAVDDNGDGAVTGAALRGGSVHVSLVIENELKPDTFAGNRSGGGGLPDPTSSPQDSFDGVTGISNALAVVLELDHTGAHLCLRLSDKNAAAATSSGLPASSRLPNTLDIVQLRERPIAGAPHSLLVEYDASDASAPTLRVYLDDPIKESPPAMTTSIAIHKALTLDVGAGDAAAIKVHAGVSAGARDSLGGLGGGDSRGRDVAAGGVGGGARLVLRRAIRRSRSASGGERRNEAHKHRRPPRRHWCRRIWWCAWRQGRTLLHLDVLRRVERILGVTRVTP